MQTQLTVQCVPDPRAKKHLLPFLVVNFIVNTWTVFLHCKTDADNNADVFAADCRTKKTTALLQTQKRVAFLWAAAMQKH